MGCYDYFVGHCPNCGSEFSAQTKLGKCEFSDIDVGDKAHWKPDVRLRVKTPCPGCGVFPVAVIADGVLRRYEVGPADKQEGLFGNVYPDGERPDDEFAQIMVRAKASQ